ncbi:MAG: threonine synthase [Chlamydiae bacterium]|nr:threonine synthase [Chlamydiota bacterium]MBI3278077.1 threonine synthase [Chlamydiota bacterium]
MSTTAHSTGTQSYTLGLKCRECQKEYSLEPVHVCEDCFGPLEVVYDYAAIKKVLTREVIHSRKTTMWRYQELLPLSQAPTVGLEVGFTPFFRSKRLAEFLGLKELYIKNDAVNHPTLSFKDRVVAVALSKAKEFGFKVVACASTGNLANSVAANAAHAGLESYIFIPADLEQGKVLGTLVFGTHLVGIRGTYDEVNRLSSEIADKYGWAFVNINIRPFYGEGSKTYTYEIMEQMGWRTPQHIVVPMAGGSLITKVRKAMKEFYELGLVEDASTKIYGAQAEGCAPIVHAVKAGHELFKPEKPNTIAKSLAIGNPADGYYAIKTIKETGGWADAATDEEIVDAMKLLAVTEGIFTETAGGVTLATLQKLIRSGHIPKDECVVLCITGNGLKTQEALIGKVGEPQVIDAKLSDFDRIYKS